MALKFVRKVVRGGKTRQNSNKMDRNFEEEFPITLEGFGYHFNDAGQLRHTESGIPFRFDVRQDDQSYNQRHYEALGQVVENHVYQLLEEQEDLQKVEIPLDAVGEEPRSFIFKSRDMEKQEKLLILIHGSGVVRAGQWSRSLIINHSLESGSQIQYIQKAKQDGYGVIVLNTNQNNGVLTNQRIVRGSEKPSDHFLYLWDKIIMRSAARSIAIMAHSYGGCVVLDLLHQRPGEMMNRVFAIAMSDSVHSFARSESDKRTKLAREWFIKHARNWVSSDKRLDKKIQLANEYDCTRVSAGTMKHVETSWYAFKSVFRYLKKRLEESGTSMSRVEARVQEVIEEPMSQDQKHGTGELMSKNQRHGTGEPMSQDQRHGTGEPMSQDQRHGAEEPMSKDQRHGTEKPMSKDQRHGTGEPMSKEQRHGTGETNRIHFAEESDAGLLTSSAPMGDIKIPVEHDDGIVFPQESSGSSVPNDVDKPDQGKQPKEVTEKDEL